MGIPRTQGLLYLPWQPLGIPSAITPIGQLHQSPPSPIPGGLGRCPSHQSHVLEHRDTYGQAQVCSKGHQGSSVDRPCQPSFHWIKFCHVRNPLPQSIRLHLIVLVRYWAGQGEWSLSWTTSDGEKNNQRTYHSHTTTAWRLSTLRCLFFLKLDFLLFFQIWFLEYFHTFQLSLIMFSWLSSRWLVVNFQEWDIFWSLLKLDLSIFF